MKNGVDRLSTRSSGKGLAVKIKRGLFSGTALPVLALSLFMAPASAQTVWDGDTDTEFSTGTNWVGDVAPGALDEVTINNAGLGNQPVVTGVETVDIANLSDGSLTISVAGSLTVTNTFNLSATGILNGPGIVTAGATSISGGTVSAGAVLSGNHTITGGVINGTLNGGNFNVNVGAPMTIGGLLEGGGQLTLTGGALTLTNANTYSGGTTVASGTLRLEANTAAGTGTITTTGSVIDYANGVNIANPININSNTTQLQVLVGTATQSGIISETAGPRPLEKIGAGTLVLAAANTYTGATTLTAGTLQMGASERIADASDLIVNGGIFDVQGFDETVANLSGTGGAINILTGGGLIINQTANQTFAGNFTGTSVLFDNTIVKNGAGTLTLTGTNSMTGAGFARVNDGRIQVSGGNAIGDNQLVTGAGTFELLGNETVGLISSGLGVELNGNTLTLAGDGTAAVVGAGHTGIISGTGNIIIDIADDNQSFNGANTYTGSTTINSGLFQTVNASALGVNGAVTVNAGGTLELGANLNIGSLAGAGAVTLNANTLTTGGNNTSTSYSGVMSGAGGLTKTGTGTQTLAGANTYTGATTVSAGTLQISANERIANTSDLIVNGGIFDLQGFVETVANLSGTGGAINTLAGGSLIVNQTANLTFAGNFTGTSGFFDSTLVKNGAGTLTLTGANSIAGRSFITINAGILQVSGGNAIGDNQIVTGPGTFELLGNETIGVISVGLGVELNGNTLTLAGDGSAAVVAAFHTGIISGTGNIVVNAGNDVQSFSGANTYTGSTTINGGTLQMGANERIADASDLIVNGGTFDLQGFGETVANLSGTGGAINILAGGTLTVTQTANQTFAGNFTGATNILGSAIVKNGGGTLTLTGTNSMTGAGVVSINAGTLQVSGGNAIGDNQIVTGPGTFELLGNETIGLLSSGVGVDLNGNTLTLAGDGSGVLVGAGHTGIISGTGNIIVNIGNDNQTFTGANTYSGSTTINSGTVFANNLSALGNNGPVTINAGGTLNLQANLNIGSLAGAGAVTLNANTLTTGGNNTSTTFSGIATGTGGLTKTGTGTFTLTGANTVANSFTGVANVDAGILRVNGTFGDIAGPNTAQVNVNNGGRLEGTGTIAGNVTVNNGGTVAAGTSPGTLIVGGNYTLNAGSNSIFELGVPGVLNNANNDLIVVGGNLTVAGALTIGMPNALGTAAVSGYYNLFDVAGTTTGAFATVTNGGVDVTATTSQIITNGGAAPSEFNILLQNGGQLVQFWDGTVFNNDPAATGPVGLNGTWNGTNTNWTTANGQFNDLWRSQVGVFSGGAGIVTVAGTQAFQGLQFVTSGYTINGGTLNATGDAFGNATASFLNADAGTVTTIGSVIAGAGIGIDKLGTGTVILTGLNTYTGTTTVAAGTLAVAATGGLASATNVNAGAIFINAGTVANVSNAGTFTNQAGGAAGAVTNSGAGSNAGNIASLSNSGTFGNTGAIAGNAANTAGTTTNTGSVGGTLTVSGGLFDQNIGGTVAGATTISGGALTNAGTLAAVVNQAAGTFTNEVGGIAGAVTNSGAGSNAGTIASLSNSGTFGNTATITGNAVNSAGTTTNTGSVGGTLLVSGGTFDQNAGGTVAGATTISGGALTNAGTLAAVVNQAAGTFTNEVGGIAGAVTNSGTTTNAGTVASATNANLFTNLSVITGAFTQSAGTMTNTGSIGGLATVNGGTFTNNGGVLNGGLTNNGIFNSNAGTLNGTVNVLTNNGTFNQTGTTAASGIFNNAGTFNMNGSALNGFSAYNNTGTLNALGASTLGGPVNNTGGTISLADGATDDVLTVNGALANGAGGTYNLDLALTNAAAGLVDRIAVNGSLSGTVNVNFTPTVVSTRDTPGDTLVISSTDNSGSAVGTVTGLISGPFVQYNLVDSGNDYVIRTTLNLGTLGGLVGSLSSVQNIVNSAVNRPTSAFVATPIGVEPDTCAPGVYGRMTGGTSTASATTSSPLSASATSEVSVNYGGFQAGVDYGCFNIGGDGASVNLGLLGGVSLGTASQNQNLIASSNRFTSKNVGAYATYSKGRFFADVQAVYDWTRFEISSMANNQVFVQDDKFDTRRFTVSGSMGYAFSFDDVSVVPTAGFSYSRTSADNVTIDAAPGGTLQFNDVENMIGFASLSVAKTYILPNETSALQPFVTATIYNDFAKDPVVNYIAPSGAVTPTSTTNFGTYGELSVGVNYRNILEAENGKLREVSASIRGDVTFNEDLLGGRITANLRLQF